MSSNTTQKGASNMAKKTNPTKKEGQHKEREEARTDTCRCGLPGGQHSADCSFNIAGLI